MAAPGPGYGRGGRGAALLKALQQPIRKPGESSPGTEQPQTAPAPPVAMGRGAMLQHLQMQASMGRGGLVAHTPAATAPAQPAAMGRGMAALSGASMPMGRGIAAMPMGRGTMAMMTPAAAAPAAVAPTAVPGMPMGRGAMGRGLGAPTLAAPAVAAPAVATPTPVASPPRQPSASPPAAPAPGPGGDDPERKRLSNLEYMVSRLSTDEPVKMHGTSGERVDVMVNAIPVRCNLKGVFQYAVSFSPQIDSKGMRYRMIDSEEIKQIIGPVRAFDGAILFLPKKLEQDPVSAVVQRSTDGADITVTMKLVRTIPPAACIQVFNVIFRRAMSHLKLVQVGRFYYDCHNPSKVPAHRMEVWPGYITSISESEGGLMLLTDVTHRVLRTETVLDKFADVFKSCKNNDDFHRNAAKAVIGVTVLTRYNNKMYRVDDIDWSRNPLSTFTLANGETTTFVDYYQRNYKVVIKDQEQPLLIHRPKQREQREQRGGRASLEVICLIPELSHMTGLTDDIRADFHIMKDLGAHTRVIPNERRKTLRKLCENLANHPESRAELAKWGLSIDMDIVKTYARILPQEKIKFATGTAQPRNADWGRDATNHRMLCAVNLENWVVIHGARDSQNAQAFVNMLLQVAPQLGMQVARPVMQKLDNPRTDGYIKALQRCIGPQVQLVVTIFQTRQDAQYAAIKKYCCDTAPIASQVIISRTIRDQRKLRSVTQKVALQINCKLGGELWAVDIPVTNLMVIGMDVYHDKARQGQSVAGFVASLNSLCTRWFSTVCHQLPGQELSQGLKVCFTEALRKYNQENHHLPDRIVIFRDGVGDGQLKVVANYEVSQLTSCFAQFGESYQPKLAVIVVQKRIDQKIFAIQRQGLDNPSPGTVVDHTITRKEWYDFFLVSQFVRQGTVNPTHYVVVHDTINWKPDIMQRLAYKLTHLYYNWPGTIRTPAPCQYAHKLAQLVGQCIHKAPSPKLCERLFFL